jgi:hypothetical protein
MPFSLEETAMRLELGEIIISEGVKPRFTNAKLLAFTELYLI